MGPRSAHSQFIHWTALTRGAAAARRLAAHTWFQKPQKKCFENNQLNWCIHKQHVRPDGLVVSTAPLELQSIPAPASLASARYGLCERDAFNRLPRPQKNSIGRNAVTSSEPPKEMAATSNFFASRKCNTEDCDGRM